MMVIYGINGDLLNTMELMGAKLLNTMELIGAKLLNTMELIGAKGEPFTLLSIQRSPRGDPWASGGQGGTLDMPSGLSL